MCLQRFISPFVLLICLSSASFLALANPLPELQKQLQDHTSQLQKLQQEYEFIQLKRQSAQEKLAQSQRELAEKTQQLANLQADAGAAPSAERKAFLDNEAQRLALAELTLKSSTAAVVRLERNEERLRESITAAEKAIKDTDRAMTNARARQEAD